MRAAGEGGPGRAGPVVCPLPVITLLIRGAEQTGFSLPSVIETSPRKRRSVPPKESTNEGVRPLQGCVFTLNVTRDALWESSRHPVLPSQACIPSSFAFAREK